VTLHNETAVIFKYPYFPDESIDYRVLNVSYDYGSIMHSPSKIGFEKNFRFLSANKRNLSYYYEKMMGQYYKVTFTDWKIINKFYCNDFCKKNTITCKNDGYPHPRNCTSCICPDGFIGDNCKQISNKVIVYEATEKQKSLFHEGKNNVTFRIKAQNNHIILLSVIEMETKDQIPCYYGSGQNDHIILLSVIEMETKDQIPCYYGSGIEIKHLKYKGVTGLCLCGFNRDIEIVTDGNEALIRYVGRSRSDFFYLEYIAIDCSQYGTTKPQQSKRKKKKTN
uniref:Astacin domain-containing protein n=2 Tax=Parastrongyloides trichosuri TaxID=131310 RepID=A0A0N4ZAR5_PARTI